MTAADHRRYDQLRADRQIVNEGAMWLRADAIAEQFAGFQRKERAFALAGLLDTLVLQLDRVPEAVRAGAILAAEVLIDQRGMSPHTRRIREIDRRNDLPDGSER